MSTNQSNGSEDSGSHSNLIGDAIPTLAASRPAKANRKAAAVLILGMLALLAVGGFMVKAILDKRNPKQEAEKPLEIASSGTQKLAVKANPPRPYEPTRGDPATSQSREPKFAGEEETAESVLQRSRHKVPGVQDEGGEAKPIRVIRKGDRAADGKPLPPNPVDAPVFAANPRTGGAAGYAPRNGRAPSMEADEQEANDLAFKRSLADMQKRKADLEAQLAKIQSGAGAPAAGGGMLPPPGFMQTAQAAFGQPGGGASEGSQAEPNTQLLGGMEKSATPRVYAGAPLNRSLTIPKGQIFQCALKTKVVTATSGFVSCLVQRDVYSHDGKVVLVERGSHMDGEYRMVNVRPGLTRIPVVWTRILTPNAIPVDLESPAVGQLGESGIGGHVDNRWPERIGAALLISLIDDSIKALLQNGNEQGNQVYLSSTSAQGSKLAEEVLKTTVNIPPLLYQNQGSVVGVYVARDLDFSKVYRLEPQQ